MAAMQLVLLAILAITTCCATELNKVSKSHDQYFDPNTHDIFYCEDCESIVRSKQRQCKIAQKDNSCLGYHIGPRSTTTNSPPTFLPSLKDQDKEDNWDPLLIKFLCFAGGFAVLLIVFRTVFTHFFDKRKKVDKFSVMEASTGVPAGSSRDQPGASSASTGVPVYLPGDQPGASSASTGVPEGWPREIRIPMPLNLPTELPPPPDDVLNPPKVVTLNP